MPQFSDNKILNFILVTIMYTCVWIPFFIHEWLELSHALNVYLHRVYEGIQIYCEVKALHKDVANNMIFIYAPKDTVDMMYDYGPGCINDNDIYFMQFNGRGEIHFCYLPRVIVTSTPSYIYDPIVHSNTYGELLSSPHDLARLKDYEELLTKIREKKIDPSVVLNNDIHKYNIKKFIKIKQDLLAQIGEYKNSNAFYWQLYSRHKTLILQLDFMEFFKDRLYPFD